MAFSRGIASVLIAVWLLLGTHTPLYAEETDFDTQLRSTYTVSDQGRTTVRHDIRIQNLTPLTYLREYAVRANYSGLALIKATLESGSVEPQVVHSDNQTTISITFPDALVGQNKVRQLTLEYQTDAFAIINGQALEVRIPKFAAGSSASAAAVLLRVPTEFGRPFRSLPEPSSITQEEQYTQIEYASGAEGVVAFFGQTQLYDLNLSYELTNPGAETARMQIALPPTTRHQTLSYQQLIPTPVQMRVDEDGNWLATYLVEPNQTLNISAQAQAQLTLDENMAIPQTIPDHRYTQAQPFWETTDPNIQNLTQELTGPSEINRRVINLLEYSLTPELVTARLGATQAMSQPDTAVCEEYTDLFIALARAQQIPTRRMVGYAYSVNPTLRPTLLQGDILHAWPEYYKADTGDWHAIDPTWEDTTGGVDYFSVLDLNHIVFVINGLSSERPYPVGAYRRSDDDQPKVRVKLATNPISPEEKITLQLIPQRVLGLPLPGLYQAEITNLTGTGWYNGELSLAGDAATVIRHPQTSFESWLPFETKRVTAVVLSPKLALHSTPITLTIQNNLTDPHYVVSSNLVTALPSALAPLLNRQTATVVVISSIAGALITGSLLVFRLRRTSSVRRQSQKITSTPP